MGTRSSTNGRKREILVKQRDQARKMAVVLAHAALNRAPPVTFTEDGERLLKSWSDKLGLQWPA
jgi:hypothetical protein